MVRGLAAWCTAGGLLCAAALVGAHSHGLMLDPSSVPTAPQTRVDTTSPACLACALTHAPAWRAAAPCEAGPADRPQAAPRVGRRSHPDSTPIRVAAPRAPPTLG